MCCGCFSCLPAKLYYRSVLSSHGTIIMRKTLTALLLVTVLPAAHADDDYTHELYELYCQACHGAAVSGAPRSFSRDWQPWLKKGLPQMVENAIRGTGNMPAMGTCNECGPQELEDLIRYMSREQ
ncbi:hypothetical protein GJQ55_02030 [Venatoribacter cucullus]|uniref:Uncharacterized protein n=2 Tax=Venatoribacter cucullus TaxID=2661630 RepID=A0A9E8JLB4_9GAMM|nr:hypothetical protein GJQ54_02055 [Oceanospirillaceae bacterium ASx5O]QQD23328.1 hypothetical protein GJQ55_02030 [Venatoribacter cucullus]UZK02758.1 hypothetical protein GAY96_02010 [Venatoribacter cucullus]